MTTTLSPTSDTIPNLDEAIERVYHAEPGGAFDVPEGALSDALGMWWFDVQREVFDRWACEDDACPGRPAWDVALSEQSEAALDAARAELLALFRDRMADFALLFKEEHPEAVLRPTVEGGQA